MVMKSTKYPTRGELVIGTVSKVNPFSAFVMLEEYPGVEGMIHISEVARKWIRDIRDFVKVGQKIVVLVLNVDEERGHVALSLKRVGPNEKSRKLKELKSEQKAEKMLETAAKKLGMDMETAYKEIGFELQDKIGEMFEAFRKTLTEEGRDLMKRKGIPEKWIEAMREVAEKSLESKEIGIKVDLELKSYAPDGADIIKKAILNAEKKFGIEAKYISAPLYQLVFRTKNAKGGEKTLETAAESIIAEVKKGGGEGSFKVV